MEYELRQDKKNNEFQLIVDELKGECTYVIKGTTMYFMHTGVPKSLEGHGYGSKLVRFALEQDKEQGYKIVAMCPFVIAYIDRHQEWIPFLDMEYYKRREREENG